jgi:DNA polymerase III beta subunit, N-terminal domain/DNA polymerase III beta subunit, central domain
VGVRGSHDAQVSAPGSLTVSAKKLFEIVRELPDEPLQLASTANSYLEIQCPRSRFVLAGTAGDEYPTLPSASPKAMVRIQASLLSGMIERAMYAASADETRYNLNGVYFEVLPDTGKIRMVATDGHRLAYLDRVIALGTRVEAAAVEAIQGTAQPAGEGDASRPAALRVSLVATTRAGAVDEKRPCAVVFVDTPHDLAPAKPQRLANAQPCVEQEQHEHERGRAFRFGLGHEPRNLLGLLDRPDVAAGVGLGATSLRPCSPTQFLTERLHRVRSDEPQVLRIAEDRGEHVEVVTPCRGRAAWDRAAGAGGTVGTDGGRITSPGRVATT